MRNIAAHTGANWLLRLLAFIALAITAYWPAFFSERVWDDHFLVGSNPFFRSPYLAAEAFRHWLYPFEITAYFRPVQNLSYMVDYWFWEENLFGYHLTNACLHATAALLLAILIRRIASELAPAGEAQSDRLALATGLLWLVHPIHHAAVAYTAGRADSLAAVFALSAWLSAERGIQTERVTVRALWLSAASACCALALYSKEIAITWIGLFLLYQLFLPRTRITAPRLYCALGAAGIVACYFLYRQTLPRYAEIEVVDLAKPFMSRVVQSVRALGDYISITLVPVNLHMERQLHEPSGDLRQSSQWLYQHARILLPLGIAGIALMIFACVRGSHRRLTAFATSWFLVGFLPISNLFPLNAPVAEHWIYMPSAGLILLILTSVLPAFVWRRALLLGLGACLVATLLWLTHEQSRTWVTEERMFRNAISRGGDTLRARSNLARILDAKGERQEAVAILREAIKRNPKHPALNLQLAAILQRVNEDAEAREIFQRVGTQVAGSSRRPPKPWGPEAQRVEMLVAEKRYREAKVITGEALHQWPLVWDLVRFQVLLLAEAGRTTEAVNALEEYVGKNWWHREAVILLAQYLAQLERFDEAVRNYQLAAKLDVHSAKPWAQTASIRTRQGRLPEALDAQKKAVAVEPDSREQRLRLAQLYLATGNETDALIEQQAAESLPSNGK